MRILNWKKLADFIDFKPTEQQRYILENMQRFNTIVGGKRVGKTKLAAFIALVELMQKEKSIWVVAPQYALAKVIWQYMFDWSNKYLSELLKPNTQFLSIQNLAAGSVCELKSADNPVSLKGKGLDLVIGDEIGDWKPRIWEEYIRPNVSEVRASGERGKVFLIGNANYFGSDWHQLVEQETLNKFSYHLPTAIVNESGQVTSNNPEIITNDELEELKRTTPEVIWRQNYLARFIPGQGTVFQNIYECANGNFKSPKQDRFYYIGVDLGRLQDFTVVTVIDSKTFEVVYLARFKEIDWVYQRAKILEIVHQYKNSKIIIDQTGLGQPILDDLQRSGIFVEGLKFTNESKKDLVEKLALMLEWRKISFPKIPELIKELEVFGYSMTKTGKVHYSAPSGFHDDCVISLALAAWSLQGEPDFAINPNLSPKDLMHESKKLQIDQMLSREEKEVPIIRPYV